LLQVLLQQLRLHTHQDVGIVKQDELAYDGGYAEGLLARHGARLPQVLNEPGEAENKVGEIVLTEVLPVESLAVEAGQLDQAAEGVVGDGGAHPHPPVEIKEEGDQRGVQHDVLPGGARPQAGVLVRLEH